MGLVRRIADYRGLFGEDDPLVYILAPDERRAVPAGDTRRGTAWVFVERQGAVEFGAWMRGRHGLEAVPVQVRMRQIAAGILRLPEGEVSSPADTSTACAAASGGEFQAVLRPA